MIIAYLTSQYARAGDTFIRGEVRELRALGHTVHTYSIRRPAESEVVDDSIAAERRTTRYLVDGLVSIWDMALSGAASLLRSPLRVTKAASVSFKIGQAGLKARLWQVAYLFEAAALARDLEKKHVQHLHDHIGENSGTVAMLASIISGIPFSMTIHGPSTFYAPERHALGEKISRSAFTVCISEFCRSQCMVFAPPAAWDRLRIIHCGVDTSAFAVQPMPTAPKPRLVCVGRLCAEKGQLLLVEAAAQLVAEDHEFEVVMVGDGPMRPWLESAIKKHRLEERVRITGWKGSQGVRDEITLADAMVLPSFAEGLPVVIMEALALGRPVLSTYVAGIPELLEPGTNGWLVPAGSVDALVNALRQVIKTPIEQLAAMGKAGAARVAQRHDATTEARKLSDLFVSTAKLAGGTLAAPIQSSPAPACRAAG
jgi:colanic acid/amylovoran biosynthesis glycosyltransferase